MYLIQGDDYKTAQKTLKTLVRGNVCIVITKSSIYTDCQVELSELIYN